MHALLVGLGSIGKRHLRNLRTLLPQAEITVLRHRPASEVLPEAALADRVVYRLDDALQHRVDFSIIASPAPFHVGSALTLARAGSHLFIEKPISDRMEGLDELLENCHQRQLALLVGYPLRFSQAAGVLRRAILDGSIGRVIGFRAEVGQYLPEWRAQMPYRESVSARKELGGGVLLELSHELDLARWLVGEVRSVSAQVGQVGELDLDVEDWADVNLSFASGVLGNVHLDMVQRAKTRTCRVVGTEGTLVWDAIQGSLQRYRVSVGSWEPVALPHPGDMYVEELQHFLACVRGESSPRITGQDGKQALAIALAARESARTGKTVPL